MKLISATQHELLVMMAILKIQVFCLKLLTLLLAGVVAVAAVVVFINFLFLPPMWNVLLYDIQRGQSSLRAIKNSFSSFALLEHSCVLLLVMK